MLTYFNAKPGTRIVLLRSGRRRMKKAKRGVFIREMRTKAPRRLALVQFDGNKAPSIVLCSRVAIDLNNEGTMP